MRFWLNERKGIWRKRFIVFVWESNRRGEYGSFLFIFFFFGIESFCKLYFDTVRLILCCFSVRVCIYVRVYFIWEVILGSRGGRRGGVVIRSSGKLEYGRVVVWYCCE